MEKFYITTPIYYPSGKLHIGHCYTTVCCDAIARFKRMQGYDVCYLTGMDEHGQKIEGKAKAENTDPQSFVDARYAEIKKLWSLLDITYDKFIRTTDPMHVSAVQKIFKKLYDKGDIYKSEYEGMYCVPCETFWTESQLVDGKCPDCGRAVSSAKEECYNFRLSKYSARIRAMLTETDFLRPETRVNEMVTNFIDAGLKDLAVSRTSFKWGVPVSFDDRHVVYVWIDALSNYITALGYLSPDESAFNRYWPADLHVMAKEIVRFHSVIWPAILMALELPVPKKVFGHGWILFDGGKMSNSKGNVKDPYILSEMLGADALKYYLLCCLPYGQDGDYSAEIMINRINTDLVNNLGNLVSRSTAMCAQYFGGLLPESETQDVLDRDLKQNAESLLDDITKEIDGLRLPKALERVMALAERCNKYIDETAPWVLNKDEAKRGRLKTVIYNLIESIRFLGVALKSFLPAASEKILSAIGAEDFDKTFDSLKTFGVLKPGARIVKGNALFERIDKEKMLNALQAKL